jgi:hypothetical protein
MLGLLELSLGLGVAEGWLALDFCIRSTVSEPSVGLGQVLFLSDTSTAMPSGLGDLDLSRLCKMVFTNSVMASTLLADVSLSDKDDRGTISGCPNRGLVARVNKRLTPSIKSEPLPPLVTAGSLEKVIGGDVLRRPGCGLLELERSGLFEWLRSRGLFGLASNFAFLEP